MPGIDESLTFYPLGIAVLTVSDTRTEETDKSGALLAERLTAAGHRLAGKAIVREVVKAIVRRAGLAHGPALGDRSLRDQPGTEPPRTLHY